MMATEPKNRAERRARVFTRPAPPKSVPAQGPRPELQRSGIAPLKDKFDDLMELGEAHFDVPFASKDEDLTKQQSFKDTTTAFIVEFDRQRCERCGTYRGLFSKVFEQRNGVIEVPVPRLPPLEVNVPTIHRYSPRIQYVPIGECCVRPPEVSNG